MSDDHPDKTDDRMRWIKFQIGLQLAFRASVGAALSFAIASALKLETPIFALIAAVIVTDREASETRRLSIRRIISTAIGAICGIALAQFLPSGSWAAAVAVFLSMAASIAVTQLGDPKIAAYLCALIVINYGDHPFHYAFYRFIETVLGIIVAWAISLIPKLVHLEDPDAKKT